jgi:hypothetical protein
VCHTIGGLNDIVARVNGRTEDGIQAIIAHTHEMVPFMPPFGGSDAERGTLAIFLSRIEKGQVRFDSLFRLLTAPSPAGEEGPRE